MVFFLADTSIVPKTKLRKLERKLVPVLEKLSVEELMETNTYQRFSRSIEKIFDNTEDLDLSVCDGEYLLVLIFCILCFAVISFQTPRSLCML